jgi:hypothetical protein
VRERGFRDFPRLLPAQENRAQPEDLTLWFRKLWFACSNMPVERKRNDMAGTPECD